MPKQCKIGDIAKGNVKTMEHDYYSYLQDERRTPYPDDDEALVARQAHLAGQGRFVAIFFGLVILGWALQAAGVNTH